jgi:hypothetical protein
LKLVAIGLIQSLSLHRKFGGARNKAVSLRRKMPSIYFDVAPVVVDDALATGTKYDALIKFSDNMLGYAVAVL